MSVVIALSNPTKSNLGLGKFWNVEYGFFGNEEDFFKNDPSEYYGHFSKVQIWQNSKAPNINRFQVIELELEKLPERIGSGETGVFLVLHVSYTVYSHLKRIFPESYPFNKTEKRLDRNDLVLLIFDIEEFKVPKRKTVKPDHPIPNQFNRSAEFTEVKVMHYSTNAANNQQQKEIIWQDRRYWKIQSQLFIEPSKIKVNKGANTLKSKKYTIIDFLREIKQSFIDFAKFALFIMILAYLFYRLEIW